MARQVWDEAMVNEVDVSRGRMRVAHNEERGCWEVHYVGPDITCLMHSTDSEVAAQVWATAIYRW